MMPPPRKRPREKPPSVLNGHPSAETEAAWMICRFAFGEDGCLCSDQIRNPCAGPLKIARAIRSRAGGKSDRRAL